MAFFAFPAEETLTAPRVTPQGFFDVDNVATPAIRRYVSMNITWLVDLCNTLASVRVFCGQHISVSIESHIRHS